MILLPTSDDWSGITVRGSAGIITDDYWGANVVNQGTISADDSGGLAGSFVYDQGFSGGYTYSSQT